MKKIVTIAAIAALTTLTACGQEIAPEAVATENVEVPADETATDEADEADEAADAADAGAAVAPVGQQHQL